MKIILDEVKKEAVLIKKDGTEISRYSNENKVESWLRNWVTNKLKNKTKSWIKCWIRHRS